MSLSHASKICIVTAGHLSTCPRMLKAADALADAGYDVRVVSTSWIEWAKDADVDVVKRRRGKWHWSVVRWDRQSAFARAGWSSVRLRFMRQIVKMSGASRLPLSWLGNAYTRPNAELAALAQRSSCDLFYGGGGALAATALAASRSAVPFALDLEDFHSGEHDDSSAGRLSAETVTEIERRLVKRTAFLTVGSAAIADAYRDRYGVKPIVINNTFPLPTQPPVFRTHSGNGLRLYWFSQTIGSGRGLEDVVTAMGSLQIPGELHLRGRPANGYLDRLRSLAQKSAPRLKLVVHDPAPPDEMVRLADEFEVGLAVEPGTNLNNQLALSNKAFTYMLAGLAVVLTDTPGQQALAAELGAGALIYSPGDIRTLADGLRQWATNPSELLGARRAAWDAARRRWHWEHPSERGALLDAVSEVLRKN